VQHRMHDDEQRQELLEHVEKLGKHRRLQLEWQQLLLSGADDSQTMKSLGVPDMSVMVLSERSRSQASQHAAGADAATAKELSPGKDRPRDISQLVPVGCAQGHHTLPPLPYLRWLAETQPDTADALMAATVNFTVLHPRYGAVTWLGQHDIRGLDLSEMSLGAAEVMLPADASLPSTAQVVLRGVQPSSDSPPVPRYVPAGEGDCDFGASRWAHEAEVLGETSRTSAEWDEVSELLHAACPAVTRTAIGGGGAELAPQRGGRGSSAIAWERGPVSLPAEEAADFEARLREKCQAMQSYFVQYDGHTGEWVFNVRLT
jgi:hypothetical protein